MGLRHSSKCCCACYLPAALDNAIREQPCFSSLGKRCRILIRKRLWEHRLFTCPMGRSSLVQNQTAFSASHVQAYWAHLGLTTYKKEVLSIRQLEAMAEKIGSVDYKQAFLAKKRDLLQIRLRTLCSLCAAMETYGVYACFLVLRQSLLTCVTDIMRALSLTVTLPWCPDLDHLFREACSSILCLPPLTWSRTCCCDCPITVADVLCFL